MSDPVLPLSVFVRSSNRIVDAADFGDLVAGSASASRISISSQDGGFLVRCVWFGDLDAAGAALERALGPGLLWSEPQVEYRVEIVESAKGRREVLLEPLMSVEVRTPPVCVGTVIGDLSSRRGLVFGLQLEEDGSSTIAAEVPLVELRGYPLTLAAMTSGAVTATVHFKEFIEAPRFTPGPDDPVAAALRAA